MTSPPPNLAAAADAVGELIVRVRLRLLAEEDAKAKLARDSAPGETGDADRTSVNTTDGHHSNGGRGGS